MRNGNFPRLNLDPGSELGGGGGDPNPNPGGDPNPAPEYLPASKFTEFETRFNGFADEIRQSLSQRQPEPERRAEPAKEGAPVEPKAKDYKFDQPGELERWHRDNARYDYQTLKAEEKANESKTKSEADSKLADVKAGNAHRARERVYEKENPTYRADVRAANIETYDEVKKVLRDSEFSPQLYHHIAKNPDVIDKINELGEMNGLPAVIRYVGRLEAMFEKQNEDLEGKAAAAGDRPIRHAKGNGSPEAKPGILSDDRKTRREAYRKA